MKTSTNLPEYKDTPTFQGFLIKHQNKQVITLALFWAGPRADKTENAQKPMATTSKELRNALSLLGQKVNDNGGAQSNQEVNDTDSL